MVIVSWTVGWCSPCCFHRSIPLLANSYSLANWYRQALLLLLLFLGDNPQLMADIPVFSSYLHYPISPHWISHFVPYCDLMVTPFFLHLITRYSSVSTGRASEYCLTNSLSWQIPPFGQAWATAAPRGISPVVSIQPDGKAAQHTSLSPLWPMPYCIDIPVLILIFFSLTNNSPCVTVPKDLLSSK